MRGRARRVAGRVAIVAAMATQSLYRRYRPRRFSEVKGQDHVVRALRTSVAEGREGQAYLFSGPRGTGKTTSARILAKVLNCENPQDGEPCCECESCLAVERGVSYDVHELDAASNNGVDAMRDLIEKASLGTPGRHKVYILDEVHMLSGAAEAALLKTLEEPPPHVVFVLATTDPQKMSDTIRSRTQHLQFHLLPRRHARRTRPLGRGRRRPRRERGGPGAGAQPGWRLGSRHALGARVGGEHRRRGDGPRPARRVRRRDDRSRLGTRAHRRRPRDLEWHGPTDADRGADRLSPQRLPR